MRIAIAACATNPVLSASNQVYHDRLEAMGADVRVLNWNGDDKSDFIQCDLTVLRQTWDYQADPGGFAAWLVRLNRLGAKTEPTADLAVWNNDKRTLIELIGAEVDVPHTLPLTHSTLQSTLESIESEQLVLKPAFGGDGVGVTVTTRSELSASLDRAKRDIPGRPMMVQEFLPEIAQGEWKLICIDGFVEFAVRATPREGEFRINSRFGPSIEVLTPPISAKTAAEKIMAFAGAPLCGRVDGIIRDGAFVCTELELCDPDLFLHMVPKAAEKLAAATLKRFKFSASETV